MLFKREQVSLCPTSFSTSSSSSSSSSDTNSLYNISTCELQLQTIHSLSLLVSQTSNSLYNPTFASASIIPHFQQSLFLYFPFPLSFHYKKQCSSLLSPSLLSRLSSPASQLLPAIWRPGALEWWTTPSSSRLFLKEWLSLSPKQLSSSLRLVSDFL